MPTNLTQRLPRGAIPSPRHELAAAMPYVPEKVIATPPSFLMWPVQLSSWNNYVYGDCVTAEEAFAKAAASPQTFIDENTVVQWATAHGYLNGATLTSVMTTMQTDGFPLNGATYDDGPYNSVNWTSPGTLQSAIYNHGPVKLGVGAEYFQSNANGFVTPGTSGWAMYNYPKNQPEDHCISLCGYGSLADLVNLFKQHNINVQAPNGMPTGMCYAAFTWNSIGIIDEQSMLNMTYEAWIRNPVTVVISQRGWHHNDVTVAAGNAPLAQGKPDGYMFNGQGTQHINYVGADNHVHELWWDSAGWHHGDLSDAGGGAAKGNPSGYMFDAQGTQHVIFRGTDNHVRELWWNNAGWHVNDLTAATSAPAAASDPFGYMFVGQGTQHVIFRSADNHVRELWWDNAGWHHNDQTTAAGAPAATGNPSAYMFPAQGTQHVNYLGTDGHIHELWWDGTWHHNDLTAASGAPAGAGDPAGYMFTAQSTQHVVYRGTDSHINELWWDNAGWHHNDLTAASGAPAASGNPNGYTFDAQGTQHVIYRGADAHIHELWWDSAGWHHNDLTTSSSGAPSASSDPIGYMFNAQGTQHVIYRGTDNHIHELWWG